MLCELGVRLDAPLARTGSGDGEIMSHGDGEAA
mgnify:CR=1 FL=1